MPNFGTQIPPLADYQSHDQGRLPLGAIPITATRYTRLLASSGCSGLCAGRSSSGTAERCGTSARLKTRQLKRRDLEAG